MQLKSFLAGGAVVAVLASIVSAEQIAVPNQFAAGSPARAAEVNANFDVLVQESNAQDTRIAALRGDLEKVGLVEQMFCAADPRDSAVQTDDLGREMVGFPTPVIRYQANGVVLASILETGALCISPSDPGGIIETTARELAETGWNYTKSIDGGDGEIQLGSGPRRGSSWHLYERRE